MTRKPYVAGQFYPEDAKELEEALKQSFLHSFGPLNLPGERGKEKIAGAIVPHAGYVFSGPGAAHAYKELSEAEFPDTYIILGVNHNSPITCTSDEEWETPLGIVKPDLELIEKLKEKGINVDNDTHAKEHSIEVQLPFLQFISKDKDLKIVPIMIADDRFMRWGKYIYEAIEELDKNVVIICSSDFTHYGDNYGFIPFEDNISENMKKLDLGAIENIKAYDPEGFLDYCDKTGATICGKHAIATLIWLMKEKKAELLTYYTSGDVLGSYDNAVGYASILFR